MKESQIWGIHAGRTGEAFNLERKVIAIGWAEVGDLSKLPANRDAFKEAVANAYPDIKPGAIPPSAGVLFRFVHEIMEGDLVAYPSKHNRKINLGKVTGPYKYSVVPEPRYPHHRPVQWLATLPRTHFSQGALYEIGRRSACSLSNLTLKNFGLGWRGKRFRSRQSRTKQSN